MSITTIEIRDHSLNIVENYESIAKEKLYKNTSLNNETKRIPKALLNRMKQELS